MQLIQRKGRFENWALPAEERKRLREVEKKRVVGIRWVWVALRRFVVGLVGRVGPVRKVRKGGFRGDGRGIGEGEEIEMSERVRLERMHTQRRARQNDRVEKKKAILREIERLKAEGEACPDADAEEMGMNFDLAEIENWVNNNNNNTYDIEAQPPRQVHRTNADRIRHLQEELQQLEDSLEAAHITSNIPSNINITTQSQTQKPLPQLPRTPALESLTSGSGSTPQPPSGETVTDSEGERTLVNSSPRRIDHFAHPKPTLTNGRFNTPESPTPNMPSHLRYGNQHSPTLQSRARGHPNDRGGPNQLHPNQAGPSQEGSNAPRKSEDTWQYNDSDSENEISGGEEGIFSCIVQRAREVEAGDAVPRRRIRQGPAAENTRTENVPNFSTPAGPARPGTPQDGVERSWANDYMEGRVPGEELEERRPGPGDGRERPGGEQGPPDVGRPGNVHIPRKPVGQNDGTFLDGDSDDEVEE